MECVLEVSCRLSRKAPNRYSGPDRCWNSQIIYERDTERIICQGTTAATKEKGFVTLPPLNSGKPDDEQEQREDERRLVNADCCRKRGRLRQGQGQQRNHQDPDPGICLLGGGPTISRILNVATP